ncbi:hypothetical protein C5F63_07080 [Photobacterium damselae subsp. damselae]|uniref:DUF2913 family protein n=1 Tax=Photobacterium damselae TaxID=38293 RepID=UPI000D059166|nr:DUF2913 family protein [Photobacterium damselae]PSB88739.1 hypothetical protein C5F63_07080 [Photobacterium damselae subsp. damselae]
MSNNPYHALLSDVVDNALLHLYSEVSTSARFVPTIKRNKILVRYLKPKFKSPKYKLVKAELKTMIGIGRNQEGNLEVKLIELNQLANKHRQDTTDAYSLFQLMGLLNTEYDFDSKLFNPDVISVADVIYILPDHIEHCFSDDGIQVAPISLFIESERVQELLAAIQDSKLFMAEMTEWNDLKKQAHILLHPIMQKKYP